MSSVSRTTFESLLLQNPTGWQQSVATFRIELDDVAKKIDRARKENLPLTFENGAFKLGTSSDAPQTERQLLQAIIQGRDQMMEKLIQRAMPSLKHEDHVNAFKFLTWKWYPEAQNLIPDNLGKFLDKVSDGFKTDKQKMDALTDKLRKDIHTNIDVWTKALKECREDFLKAEQSTKRYPPLYSKFYACFIDLSIKIFPKEKGSKEEKRFDYYLNYKVRDHLLDEKNKLKITEAAAEKLYRDALEELEGMVREAPLKIYPSVADMVIELPPLPPLSVQEQQQIEGEILEILKDPSSDAGSLQHDLQTAFGIHLAAPLPTARPVIIEDGSDDEEIVKNADAETFASRVLPHLVDITKIPETPELAVPTQPTVDLKPAAISAQPTANPMPTDVAQATSTPAPAAAPAAQSADPMPAAAATAGSTPTEAPKEKPAQSSAKPAPKAEEPWYKRFWNSPLDFIKTLLSNFWNWLTGSSKK